MLLFFRNVQSILIIMVTLNVKCSLSQIFNQSFFFAINHKVGFKRISQCMDHKFWGLFLCKTPKMVKKNFLSPLFSQFSCSLTPSFGIFQIGKSSLPHSRFIVHIKGLVIRLKFLNTNFFLVKTFLITKFNYTNAKIKNAPQQRITVHFWSQNACNLFDRMYFFVSKGSSTK